MTAKAFSIGVRIEHPQSVIDKARWGMHAGHPMLGAADYKLVHHAANGRAVYSFCMCPGGTVVAVDTEFMRRNTFYPQVALVQLCFGDKAWLVDPLQITDPSPLAQLLVNPAVAKVLHSAKCMVLIVP